MAAWRKHRDQRFVERWSRTWQASPWRFAFVFGLLGWGLPVAIGSWALVHLAMPDRDLSNIDWMMSLMTPFILVAGLVYGRFVWSVFNTAHGKLVKELAAQTST